MKKIYLACPYSHPCWWVRFIRWLKISILSLDLMRMGYVVFSPITHSVPITWWQKKDEETHEFWLSQDFPFLDWCDMLLIATFSGWNQSYGVSQETKYAQQLNKEIRYINPKTRRIY